jgi:uncharacterized protein (TIGR01619 family)
VGLLNLFKKKEATTKAGSGPVSYKSQFELYYKNIEHKLGVVSVDLGLAKVVPLHYQYNLLWLSLKMTNPLANGLTSPQERKQLEEVEEKVISAITNKYDSSFIAKTTSAGFRKLYFYAGDLANFSSELKIVTRNFPLYQFSFEIKEDVDWSLYFDFLMPNELQYQSILNRHEINKLQEDGDSLEQERLVLHHLKFKNKQGRESFLNFVKIEGFKFENEKLSDDDPDFPAFLEISRVDHIDMNHIDQFVLSLRETANRFDGQYINWETNTIINSAENDESAGV